jgi:hypothetical protein
LVGEYWLLNTVHLQQLLPARRVIAPRAAALTGIEPGTRARRLSMIRKLKTGEYRLYSQKVDPKTGKRRNLGTFKSRAEAEKHERAVQFFKKRG